MEDHPFKDTKRAVRRFHVARLKRTRKNYWGYPNNYHVGRDEPPVTPIGMSPAQLGKMVQNPQMCSCLGCGNQRHNTAGWTPTLQEKRWFIQYQEQVEEALEVNHGEDTGSESRNED